MTMLESIERTAQHSSPGRIFLRPKQLGDAIDDYRWRKDPLLAHLDATTPINLSFDEYLSSYREELERPGAGYYHFAIETHDGRHIGNCMLYDIDEDKREAQLGILIGERDYWDRGYGQEAVDELLKQGFEMARIWRVYLNTLRDNFRAQKCFERCGFKNCGTSYHNGYDFVVMETFRQPIEDSKIPRF